jgi:hypothetical protein
MGGSGLYRQLTVTVEALFAELGYDGCRQLREALRLRMAEHRQSIADERRAAGLSRPRSARKATRDGDTAQLMGPGFVSETGIQRSKAVEKWAPHLVQEMLAGNLTTWAAYQQAIWIRDQAALAAAGVKTA